MDLRLITLPSLYIVFKLVLVRFIHQTRFDSIAARKRYHLVYYSTCHGYKSGLDFNRHNDQLAL